MDEIEIEQITKAVLERFGMSLVSDRLLRRDRIPLLHAVLGAIRVGEFTLSSGAKSDFYIDARTVTMNPAVMSKLGCAIFDHARVLGATAIGGPATAAITMATAAALVSTAYTDAPPLKKSFYVRPEAKKHGTKCLIEGLVPGPDEKVLLVDDVLTSGGSLLHAAEVVRAEGAKIVGALVIVDRQEGGAQKLDVEQIEVSALYKKSELMPIRQMLDEIEGMTKTKEGA